MIERDINIEEPPTIYRMKEDKGIIFECREIYYA